MELRSLRTANAELELEEPVEEEPEELDEPPAARPAVEEAAPAALDPEPLEELELEEARVVPLPDTVSPTWPDSETIVPSSGA